MTVHLHFYLMFISVHGKILLVWVTFCLSHSLQHANFVILQIYCHLVFLLICHFLPWSRSLVKMLNKTRPSVCYFLLLSLFSVLIWLIFLSSKLILNEFASKISSDIVSDVLLMPKYIMLSPLSINFKNLSRKGTQLVTHEFSFISSCCFKSVGFLHSCFSGLLNYLKSHFIHLFNM